MVELRGKKEYFGIDFGTTNIAVEGLEIDYDRKTARRVLYGEANLPFSSMVAAKEEEDGSLLIEAGREVRRQFGMLEDKGYTIIRSIKTALGSDTKYSIGNREYTPTQIAGALIDWIRRECKDKRAGKASIDAVSVAVPVDFTEKQRKELMKAFRNVGIRVDKIVSEPMAAYIRYRKRVAAYSTVMVFDWGGGTLDISLLDVVKGKVCETSSLGWKVAGDMIDEEVAKYVHEQLVADSRYHIDVNFKELSAVDKNKLLNECESAKIDFSDGEDDDVMIDMSNYCGEKSVHYALKRSDFEEKISPIIAEAVDYVEAALEKANKSLIDLNAILLVGGSSKLPLLESCIDSLLKNSGHHVEIIRPEKPQWSVAEGAAVIDCVDCQYELNQDIGIVMSDDSLCSIIPKGSKIPFDGAPTTFGTVDDARSANFIVGDELGNILLSAPVILPAKGFLGEYFEVKGCIDNSLVAVLTFSNSRMMGSGVRKAEINSLTYSCDISAIDKFEFEIRG